MLMHSIVPLFAVAIALQSPSAPSPTTAPPSQDPALVAQRDADVHNYLVLRLRLLKRGSAVEELKAEIVNQIDFATISPRSLELLRRMMLLCDKAISGQAQIAGKLAAAEQEAVAADTHNLISVGGALVTIASGGSLTPFLAALPTLNEGDVARATRDGLLAQNAAALGSEISMMEFDLAVVRSQIQSEGKLAATAFVLPGDYDTFLSAVTKSDPAERISGVVSALERSPGLQPAAVYLAVHFATANDDVRCTKYADQAIQSAPGVLGRDGLRAQALLCKANVTFKAKDYAATVELSNHGLRDDPAHAGLLWLRGTAGAFAGDYAGALPSFESLSLIVPTDPLVLYNLACCQCMSSKSVDVVLQSFEGALRQGFADVAHAKVDPDLTLLREKRAAEFTRLTSLRLGLRMNWEMLDQDRLVVVNEGTFPLRGLDLKITFNGIGDSLGSSKPWSVERTATIADLAPGKLQRIERGVDMTRDMFRSVKVIATGPQGRFEVERSIAELDEAARATR